MFSNLKNKEGIIQYIGWFRSSEPNDYGGLEECWNIVLELADFDFYTAIRKESPPISAKEILGFWQTMAEISGALASIHTVVVDGQHYLTYVSRCLTSSSGSDNGELDCMAMSSPRTSSESTTVLSWQVQERRICCSSPPGVRGTKKQERWVERGLTVLQRQ